MFPTFIISFILDCLTAGLYTQYTLIKAPLGFQNPASIAFINIVDFHDYIMLFLVFIFLVVVWHLFWALNLRSNVFSLLFILIYIPKSFYNFLKINYLYLYSSYVFMDLRQGRLVDVDEMHEFIDYDLNSSDFLKQFYSVVFKFNVLNVPLFFFRLCSLFVLLNIEKKKNMRTFIALFANYYHLGNYLNFWTFFSSVHPEVSGYKYLVPFVFKYAFYADFFDWKDEWLLKVENKFLINTRYLTHAPTLEIVWTIFPSIILFAIAVPSLILLYQLDHIEPVSLVIKVVGHQWYWSYEIGSSIQLFSDYYTFKNFTPSVVFDSYMLNDSSVVLRLLEVDNALFVPVHVPLTFLITSTDVLHSWAVPSLGIKVDAIPGRLNQVGTNVLLNGIFYGQCSELCGVNHGFMPINIVAYNELS